MALVSLNIKQYKFMKYFILKWSSEKKQNNKTKRSLWCRLLHKMIVPLSANPDFDDKIEDVTLWFIEYDDVVNHIANREIGFAKDGRIIVKMPGRQKLWLLAGYKLRIGRFQKDGYKYDNRKRI